MAIESIAWRRRSAYFSVVLLVILSANFVQTQYQQNPSKQSHITSSCSSKTTCHDCIRAKSCAWCLQPDLGDRPRCFEPEILRDYCKEEFEWDPPTEQRLVLAEKLTLKESSAAQGSAQSRAQRLAAAYVENQNTKGRYSSSNYSSQSYSSQSGYYSQGGSHMEESHTSYSHSESGRIVQIYPQRVNLKLRINQEHRLNIHYSQAKDYPVDLYYLMDLSKSMEDDKEKLSKLGDSLTRTMLNITKDFRLGFGSFVDKVLMPYVSTVPKKLEHPCDKCEAPYGYRNHMPLSLDTETFSEKVRSAAVSGNLDAPEGGFDAIMQAVVCRNNIGWRDQARRLLVFSTDAGFHYAGDGKLGGVITPNDGECHLSTGGEYTHSDKLDYPSISQINQKVKQNSINVIFAVTSQQAGVYQTLSKHVEGSTSGILSEDSSNVVDLVREQYDKISSSVEMKTTIKDASYVKVTFYSSCLEGGAAIATSKCDGLKVGDIVNFTAEIVVTQCPDNPNDWFQTFQIYPVGINESLTVDLEMLCGCPCEKRGHLQYREFAPECNTHGTYKCGICECEPHYFGRKCECSGQDLHSISNRDRQCRPENATIDCSGRGQCVCGVCECEKRKNFEEQYSGPFCECDNFSCERSKGLLCGGSKCGKCHCGVCKCEPGWSGPGCTCSTLQDQCINKKNNEICSNRGECKCNECKCNVTTEGRFAGKLCEKCPSCNQRCEDLKACVQCQVHKTGPMGNNPSLCSTNCTDIVPIDVETLETNESWKLCQFIDENDCIFEFVYNDDDINNIEIKAKKKLECPAEIFILGIVMGVIASIVLIGLALLFLWKILTTIHDRREFAKFEKERRSAKWDTGENPIYKQATSTFKNPTYNGGR